MVLDGTRWHSIETWFSSCFPEMLEIIQILLIFLTLCGVGVVLLARASLAQLGGLGTIALEGCASLNGSWHDAAPCACSLLSWNSAHRPPPCDDRWSRSVVTRADGPALDASGCGPLGFAGALARFRRL